MYFGVEIRMTYQSRLDKLYLWLKSAGFNSTAQVVKQLNEKSLVEEVELEDNNDEFDEEPISEDEYFEQEFSTPLDMYDYTHVPAAEIHAPQNHVYNAILKQHNIQPVSVGGKSPLLGAGRYGVVSNVIYKGKPAVVKIIVQGFYDENEVSNWRHVLSNLDKLPENERKHIPEIYDIISGEMDVEHEGEVVYDLIIMEQLRQLPAELKNFFTDPWKEEREDFDHEPQDTRSLKHLLKDEEFIYKISNIIKANVIKSLSTHMESNPEGPVKNAAELFKNINAAYIQKIILDDANNYAETSSAKRYSLASKISKYVTSIVDTFNFGISPRDLTISIDQWLSHLIDTESTLPLSYNDFGAKAEKWDFIPEMSGYVNALKTLAIDLKLEWRDLHQENVLLGADGNLKIIDIGLYNRFYS